MQASLWNLLIRDWQWLFGCPITGCPSLMFLFGFFFFIWLLLETLKQHDTVLKAERPKSAALLCKYLSSLFIFKWLFYLSSPPFIPILTWQMLSAPPSQGLTTWLNKSPPVVEMLDLHTLHCLFASPPSEYFTEICPIWLVCISAFYRPTFVLPCCQWGCRLVLFFSELILLFRLLLCVSFLCKWLSVCFLLLAYAYGASTCQLVIVFSYICISMHIGVDPPV